MCLKVSIILALSFLVTSLSASPIYVYKEADGSTHFSTKKPKGIEAKVYRGKSGSYSHYKTISPRYSVSRVFLKSRIFKDKYSDIISAASTRYGLGESLIKAVIHAESAFNPQAVSHKGAKGLMQLMPQNLKMYGVINPFDPQQNILAGSKMLAGLINRYAGDLRLALAAYNAGEGAVEKYNGVPPYQETINYVKKVLHFKKLYS